MVRYSFSHKASIPDMLIAATLNVSDSHFASWGELVINPIYHAINRSKFARRAAYKRQA